MGMVHSQESPNKKNNSGKNGFHFLNVNIGSFSLEEISLAGFTLIRMWSAGYVTSDLRSDASQPGDLEQIMNLELTFPYL